MKLTITRADGSSLVVEGTCSECEYFAPEVPTLQDPHRASETSMAVVRMRRLEDALRALLSEQNYTADRAAAERLLENA